MGSPTIAILGTGSYTPARVMTNDDLSRIVDTSDEWIFTRTGIRERRIAAVDEATSDLAAAAAAKALADAGLTASQIDLLIVDGPPWAIHPYVRGAASSLFPLIRPGGRVLLDDAARPGERVVARRWRKEHNNMDFTLDSQGAKGTLLGYKHPA